MWVRMKACLAPLGTRGLSSESIIEVEVPASLVNATYLRSVVNDTKEAAPRCDYPEI